MMRFSGFIVKNRKHVLALFFLLLIPSVLGFLNTKENYDIMSYLPASLNSRQGEAILEEKFNLSGQAFVVLENTEAGKIRELKSRMEAVEGVKQVLWLDDFEDVNLPLEFMEPQIRDNFISGDSTILLISLQVTQDPDQRCWLWRRLEKFAGKGAVWRRTGYYE